MVLFGTSKRLQKYFSAIFMQPLSNHGTTKTGIFSAGICVYILNISVGNVGKNVL